MNVETIMLIWIAALAFLPALMRIRRSMGRGAGVAMIGVWIGASTALGYIASLKRPETVPESAVVNRPIEVDSEGFVTSKTCQSCHPGEYHTWHASYHRSMTLLPKPESVLGDFDGVEVSFNGHAYKLERRGDEFWAELDDLDPAPPGVMRPRIRRRIELVTGSHNVQVYWYATGEGRKLAILPIVWLVHEGRWFPRNASFLQPPEAGASNESGRWNETCVRCHATNEDPHAVEGTVYDTRVGEFGISCEACHGPGEKHIRWHSDPANRYLKRFSSDTDFTISNPGKFGEPRGSEVCGQCHSIHLESNKVEYDLWSRYGKSYRPGDVLWDSITPILTTNSMMMDLMYRGNELETRGSFWKDGMVRVAGREYNGLLESPCFVDGHGDRKMACFSCHEMHPDESDSQRLKAWADDQLKPGMRGNEACLQCHEDFRDRVVEHTHHPADSPGSVCYNCHMPHSTYGLLKAVRNHRIESPSVRTSLETGRPHACNQCHLDRTLAWTAERMQEWYGHEPPALSADERDVAGSVMWSLTGDAGQRALMAWSFDWKPARDTSGIEWMAPYVAEMLDDDYAAVRHIAGRTLKGLPGYESFEYDSTEPRAKLMDAVDRAFDIWLERRRESGLNGYEAALINPDGSLRTAEFERLLRRRNHSPVILNE